MKHHLKYLFHILLITCGYVLLYIPIRAQQEMRAPEQLQAKFLKDTVTVDGENFSFNNIRLFNNSGSPLHLQLSYTAPDFLEMLSTAPSQITLQAGEQRIEAIRFNSNKRIAPSSFSPFTVGIRIAETGQMLSYSFGVRQKASARWRAWLLQPTISFTDADLQIPFEIQVENSGNIPDNYTIRISSSLEVNLAPDYRVRLAPGEHRIIPVSIRLTPADKRQLNNGNLEIFISNQGGEQKMLIQNIMRMGSVYSGDAPRWRMMPLAVELNLANLGSHQPFGFLNARGFLNLGKDSRLNLLFQSDNYVYHGGAINTHLATAEYVKGPWKIVAGSIVDYNNFQVDGMGAGLQYRTAGGSAWQVIGVQSRAGDVRQFNFKTRQILGGHLQLSSNTFFNLDGAQKENSYLNLSRLDWDMNGKTRLSLEAGAGVQHIRHKGLDTLLTGPQWGYHFDTRGKLFQVNSSISWYSKNFPGINKGFVYQLHEARFLLHHFFVGPYLEVNQRNYTDTRDSMVSQLFNMDNLEYGVRAGWQSVKGSIVLSGGRFSQRQDSAAAFGADMYKLSLNANWQISPKWSLSAFSNIGRMSLSGLPAAPAPLFTCTNFVNLQSGRYGLQLRYDRGPFYYYEARQIVNGGLSPRRLQITPYMELPVAHWNMSCRVQLNYMHENSGQGDMLYGYSRIQYLAPRSGWDLGLSAQYIMKGSQAPMINLSVRKTLQAPVGRNSRSKRFMVILFLDKNGNNRPDPDEDRLVNANVLVNNEWVVSNGRGEIECRNTDKDEFVFDFSRVSGVRGWMPLGGYRQVLRPGNEKLFLLPFVPGKVLTGRLFLTRDPNSSLTLPLEGLRVTAVGPKGEEYSTLTNADGAFFFNLSPGNYILTVAQTPDPNFRLVEASRQADLMHNDQLDLQFEIKQTNRQIHIRKE